MYYALVTARQDDALPLAIRLMAEPARWRLMRQLARGDHRVRELVAALGLPQNLVSYHLRQLRDGGLVTSRRSNFDARDTYYRLDLPRCAAALDDAGTALHPGLAVHPGFDIHPGLALHPGLDIRPGPAVTADEPSPPPRRFLFVCTGNSGRSPMAEALLRYRAGRRVSAASAGTHPKPLHPAAAAILRSRYRIDISGHQPVHVRTVAGQRFDCVISLCDKAREACPPFAGSPDRVHWSLPDPAAATTDATGVEAAFDRLATELDTRIHFLLSALDPVGGLAVHATSLWPRTGFSGGCPVR